MARKKITTVAGILMLTASAFNILWLAAAFTGILDLKETLHVTWVISPLPYIGLAIGFGGNTVLSNILAILFVLGILLSIMGGVLALIRRAWVLALTGAVGALICVPLLGIVAIPLTVMSKHLYLGQEKL